MKLILLILEIVNFSKGFANWEDRYKNNWFFTLGDFIFKEKKMKNYKIVFLLFFFYIILNIQLIFLVLFLISNIKIKKGGKVKNILIYIPYLLNVCIKKYIKKIRISSILPIIINIHTAVLWGFPRITINYSYISLNIIKSYDKNPEISKKGEILNYIYEETWLDTIKKLEKINNII